MLAYNDADFNMELVAETKVVGDAVDSYAYDLANFVEQTSVK